MKALPAVPFEAVLSVNQKSATLSTQSISATFIKSKAKRRQCASQFYFILFPPPRHRIQQHRSKTANDSEIRFYRKFIFHIKWNKKKIFSSRTPKRIWGAREKSKNVCNRIAEETSIMYLPRLVMPPLVRCAESFSETDIWNKSKQWPINSNCSSLLGCLSVTAT